MFDDNGPLLFPSLGLTVRVRQEAFEHTESIRQHLLDVLRAVTELPDLEYDADGYIAIRFGSALV